MKALAALRRRAAAAGLSRPALAALLLLGGVALLADLIASDLPVALRLDGRLYLLPGLQRPAALRAQDNQRLRRELRPARGDWAVMPLCEFGPTQQPEILRPPPASPDRTHWLGTDDRGRDVFARMVHGARVSVLVGFASVGLQLLVGVLLGGIAGYFRWRADFVISRCIELGLTFPTFFLVLVVMALLEGGSLGALILVLGLTSWPGTARLVRAEALRLRELDFVTAARAYGASHTRVLLRHVLPNAMAPVWVSATFGVAGAMVAEAALSFLGFGVAPPTASWGELLGQGYEFSSAWWLVLAPGAALFCTVVALNLLGESLRDAADPRRS